MPAPPPDATPARPRPTVDWQRVAEWTAAAVAGDLAPFARVFAASDLTPPEIVWSPAPAQVSTEALHHLLVHWSSLGEAGRLPHVRQIDPLDLRPSLGYVILLDALASGDFRFRLYGSMLASISGFDMTGRLMSELPASAYVAEFNLAVTRAAVQRREPVYTARRPLGTQETMVWERLALPLVDDDDDVARLLAATTPLGRDGQVIRPLF